MRRQDDNPLLPLLITHPMRPMLRREFLPTGPGTRGGPIALERATGRSRATVHRWLTPGDDCVDPGVTDLQRLAVAYPDLRDEIRDIVAGPDEDGGQDAEDFAEIEARFARIKARHGGTEART